MNPKMKNNKLNLPDEFPFPFPSYSIQKEFMSNLYQVLEDNLFGIFESPTGTGKSLSIICGALRWLCDHEVRVKCDLLENISLIEKELKDLDMNSNDDWLTAQSKTVAIVRYKEELQFQLNNLKTKEKEINDIRIRIQNKILEQIEIKPTVKKNSASRSNETYDTDDDILLEEINQTENNRSDSEDEGEEEPVNDYEGIKIYFCSRTHSQLSQFIGEVKRSPYRNDIRVVPLASRQTFCVNPEVKKLKSLSLINERCLELQKNKAGKPTQTGTSKQVIKKKKCSSGCPYNNKTAIDNLKQEIITKIHDVEELVSLGQKNSACPYYATRAAIDLSQLIVIPYNTLLHKSTREASKIKLKNNIVIIDEAHNLLDAIENMHSSQSTGNQLCLCHNQLTQYKERYEKLFSANNLLYLNQLIFVIGQLISMIGGKGGCNPIESSRKGTDTKIYTLADFAHAAEIDNYNLYKLLNFCQRSKISHKLQSFEEKYQPSVNISNKRTENGLKSFLQNISNNSKNNKLSIPETTQSNRLQNSGSTSNPILPTLSFIESLTNHCDDGRIICCRQATVGRGYLKFLLLNPAAHFEPIIKEARSIIVAGGTMQPISEFRELLFKNAGADLSRIITFSCGHVIPFENILPIVVCNGPSGKQLDYSYQSRSSLNMMNELGRILDNVCNVVPAGIVCFFPSYDYEQTIFQQFEKSGLIERLSKKKKIFREPKKSTEVDSVLAEYAKSIRTSKENLNAKPNGCLLFSVIGGKLSEGLNFSDNLGRCVIVVGLPYPNIKSPELQEKMNYLDKTVGPGSGKKHYENLCMKAVNQSIGRAVRHKDDYASVLLIDHRYSKSNIHAALPQWMTPSLVISEKFGTAFGTLTKVSFYWNKEKSKMTRESIHVLQVEKLKLWNVRKRTELDSDVEFLLRMVLQQWRSEILKYRL